MTGLALVLIPATLLLAVVLLVLGWRNLRAGRHRVAMKQSTASGAAILLTVLFEIVGAVPFIEDATGLTNDPIPFAPYALALGVTALVFLLARRLHRAVADALSATAPAAGAGPAAPG